MTLPPRLEPNPYRPPLIAGEKVTLVFLSLVPVAIPSIFMGLHVFVSMLQAYIFTILTMIYLGSAVSHEEH